MVVTSRWSPAAFDGRRAVGLRAGGEAGEPGQPPLEDAAHQVAGSDHVGVRESVVNLAPETLGLDDAGRPHHGQVLRNVGLADAHLGGQPADVIGGRWRGCG